MSQSSIFQQKFKISNEIYFLHSQSTFDYNYNEVSSLCSAQVQNWKKKKKRNKLEWVKKILLKDHFHEFTSINVIYLWRILFLLSLLLYMYELGICRIGFFVLRFPGRISSLQTGQKKFSVYRTTWVEKNGKGIFWVSWVKESIPWVS